MSFIIYDLVLLGIFLVFTCVFLYKRRKNLKKDGLLLLYRTKVGVKIIDYIGKKYSRLLDVLSYVSIILGFILMGISIWLVGKIAFMYIFQSELVSLVKIPPIMPLLPYLPQIFKMDYLPSFYFIYWILILAIIAITHEFSHGIFSVNKKVKVKNTGFGFFPFFFPIFLAAFVELDEKKMEKKKPLHQMAVLSAGTFANVITGLLFFLLIILFFNLSFNPAGVVYDTYSYDLVNLNDITQINNLNLNQNVSYELLLNYTRNEGFIEIKTNDKDYVLTRSFLEQQGSSQEYVFLFYSGPLIKKNLSNTIIGLNGVKTTSREELARELAKYSPGQKIIITTLIDDAYLDSEIILEKNPTNESLAYLGIGFYDRTNSKGLSAIMQKLSSFKNVNTYYSPKFKSADFIYDLLWWLVLISFSVAIMNMLPVGIFDGGRFFYLTMLILTKNKEKSKKIFSILTYAFLILVGLVMIFWAINMFK